MRRPWVVFLSVLILVLPFLLYCAEEHLLAQVLLFTQILVFWVLLPFLFREERSAPREWSRKTLMVTLVIAAALIGPFVMLIVERGSLHSTNILDSSAKLFSESGEALLLLGSCMATIFVIAVLIKRRGFSTELEKDVALGRTTPGLSRDRNSNAEVNA